MIFKNPLASLYTVPTGKAGTTAEVQILRILIQLTCVVQLDCDVIPEPKIYEQQWFIVLLTPIIPECITPFIV